MLMMIVAILLLTLMGAGLGFAVGLLLQGQEKAEAENIKLDSPEDEQPATTQVDHAAVHGNGKSEEQDSAANAEDTEQDVPLLDLAVIPLPPILTTLAEPKGKWIRLEGALLALPDAEKAPELLAEETGEQILTYLRTLRLIDFESPSGFLGLRDDLNETVKVMSEGTVRGVLIHGLIIE